MAFGPIRVHGALYSDVHISRCVALMESTGSNRFFPALTGSATQPTGNLLMKLAMNATSAEDFFEKKKEVIVYSSSRNPEHIRHIMFV